jgi:hypothetical protein
MRPARTLLLLVGLALLAVGHPPRVSLAQPAEMSAEEAALQLRPYVLTGVAVPDGYTATQPSVFTPASMAFFDASGASPLSVLDKFEQQGYVVQIAQTLDRSRSSSIVAGPFTAKLYIYLMRRNDDAQAIVDLRARQLIPPWQSEPLTGIVTSLGDASALYHFSNGRNESFELRWRRGNVAFQLYSRAADGEAIGLVNLGTAIDAAESGNPPIDLSGPRYTPPGSETDRLQALLRMSSIEVPAAAIPPALNHGGPTVLTTAGMILTSPQPEEMLQLLDQKWQRLIAVTYGYTSAFVSTRYFYSLSEDASVDAAAIDLRDFSPNPQPELEPMPVPLGDDGFMRHTTITVSGQVLDSIVLNWRHGALGLAIQISDKPGQISDAQAIAFAQALDAAYMQSAYAQ